MEVESDAKVPFRADDLPGSTLLRQGAEGRVYQMTYLTRPTIVKERFNKKYRHPDLDSKITRERLSWEIKSMMKCRKLGVDSPAIYAVDKARNRIFMEYVNGQTIKDFLLALPLLDNSLNELHRGEILAVGERVGSAIARMHDGGIIHGDLTTSNLLLRAPSHSVVVIDFGLSYHSNMSEDKAVDLYVLERALISTHPNTEFLFDQILKSYQSTSKHAASTISQLKKVRARGRKRTMLG